MMGEYKLLCCGYEYAEGEDLHKGMKVPACPSCGVNNPPGEKIRGDE